MNKKWLGLYLSHLNDWMYGGKLVYYNKGFTVNLSFNHSPK